MTLKDEVLDKLAKEYHKNDWMELSFLIAREEYIGEIIERAVELAIEAKQAQFEKAAEDCYTREILTFESIKKAYDDKWFEGFLAGRRATINLLNEHLAEPRKKEEKKG